MIHSGCGRGVVREGSRDRPGGVVGLISRKGERLFVDLFSKYNLPRSFFNSGNEKKDSRPAGFSQPERRVAAVRTCSKDSEGFP